MYGIEKYTQEIICFSKNIKKHINIKNIKDNKHKKIFKKGIRFPKKKLPYYQAQEHRFKKLKKKFKKQIKEELKLQLDLGTVSINRTYWKRYALQSIKNTFLKKRKYKLLKIYYDNNLENGLIVSFF